MTNPHVDHIDLETLSAYADGELKAVALARVEKHLTECASCAATLARLRSLIGAAASMPREIAAPPEAWSGIKNRVTGHGSRVTRRWWHNGWLAAAAGLVLVVGTASVTLLAGTANRAKAAKLASMDAARVPLVLASVEQNYAPTLAELRATLETQRRLLSPSTIRTLEHSLAVIDSAIAEARTALEADPASAALVDLLSMSYQRKVEFLRRATTLSSSL